jgi:ABC-type nitrate/sulfonate/bicarbonate transport system substrate-binding protein
VGQCRDEEDKLMKQLLLLGVSVLLLLGCAGGSAAPATSGGPAPSAAAAPARERIRVAYAAQSASFAAAFMAKEAGLFEEYGLDAELQFIASGPTLIQARVAGEVEFGELAAGTLHPPDQRPTAAGSGPSRHRVR